MAKRKRNEKPNGKMKRKLYEKELRKLQVELCHLQEWVKAKGLKIIIVFEGRDTAGKGGPKKKVRLSDYRGKKNVMLAFFPASFTPV